MKEIILLALMCSTFAFAGSKTFSKKNCDSVCSGSAELLHDEKGRCGCLSPQDYHPAKFCRAARFFCHREKGYSYLSLSFDRGGSHEYVGCGCFKTAE